MNDQDFSRFLFSFSFPSNFRLLFHFFFGSLRSIRSTVLGRSLETETTNNALEKREEEKDEDEERKKEERLAGQLN